MTIRAGLHVSLAFLWTAIVLAVVGYAFGLQFPKYHWFFLAPSVSFLTLAIIGLFIVLTAEVWRDPPRD